MLSKWLEELEQIHTVADLRDWRESRNTICIDNMDLSLLSYVDAYLGQYHETEAFDVRKFVSEDLSCIMYRDIPVIYHGSNNWSPRRLGPPETLSGLMDKWRKHLHGLLDKLQVPVYLAIVPEKDVVVRELLGHGEQNYYLHGAAQCFADEFRGRLAGVTSINDVINSPDSSVRNYRYYDSHLLSRDYLKIFICAIQSFGLASRVDWSSIQLKSDSIYGDLAVKLGRQSPKEEFLSLHCNNESAALVDGHPTFSSPLRSTYQIFSNPSSNLDAKVALFGDSHCSVYAQKKLTYLFANTFSRCDFYWDSMCVNSQDKARYADFVFLEISQRFLF